MTVIEPELAMAVAGTTAVSFVALTYVVVSPVVPNMTCAPLTKPVPLAVRVNCAPPLFAEVGLKLVSVGAAVTVKFAVVEWRPARILYRDGVASPRPPRGAVTDAFS